MGVTCERRHNRRSAFAPSDWSKGARGSVILAPYWVFKCHSESCSGLALGLLSVLFLLTTSGVETSRDKLQQEHKPRRHIQNTAWKCGLRGHISSVRCTNTAAKCPHMAFYLPFPHVCFELRKPTCGTTPPPLLMRHTALSPDYVNS